MSVSTRNIKKFLTDHSSEIWFWQRWSIRFRAWRKSHNRIISGGAIQHILGENLSHKFIRETPTQPDHLRMWQADMNRSKGNDPPTQVEN